MPGSCALPGRQCPLVVSWAHTAGSRCLRSLLFPAPPSLSSAQSPHWGQREPGEGCPVTNHPNTLTPGPSSAGSACPRRWVHSSQEQGSPAPFEGSPGGRGRWCARQAQGPEKEVDWPAETQGERPQALSTPASHTRQASAGSPSAGSVRQAPTPVSSFAISCPSFTSWLKHPLP